ncbi:hypothetical protein ED312_18620 [Sinomicrobium pectinilyticum]|uniref:Oligosaccharide repeat unit polymerase n=1 Tax=Sinomicrobium pectinilyticum TaxID=1084421 RepID=A0A3N0E194_SINP1|nr:hypothetical protein [Sinomicrobium pectinilyticum]RNL81624.1 hypothetical protein ED312_18620 [Sinomicrobium pectinilyticum]
MIYLYLLAALLLPFIGLFYIEGGALGGYPNNSTYPYMLYLFSFFLGYRVFIKRAIKVKKGEFVNTMRVPAKNFNSVRLKKRILFGLFVLLFISLFAFNGIDVLMGSMSKGEFRSQMGYFGFIMAIPTKYIFPALFTRLCCVYYVNKTQGLKRLKLDWFFYTCCLFVVIFGFTFGDKTMAITMLLCGLIVLFWQRTRISHVFFFGLFSLVILILTGYLFDDFLKGRSIEGVLDYIEVRAFALSGESSWKVWDLYIHDRVNFDYFSTLLGVLGSGLIYFLLGISKYSVIAYKFNFGTAVTALLYPGAIDLINSGLWNITPTAYVEGLLAGGIIGIIIFGIFGGIVFAHIYRKISKGFYTKNYAKVSIFVVYFVNAYSAWLMSGGITTLFHPVTIMGILAAYYVIRMFEKIIIK